MKRILSMALVGLLARVFCHAPEAHILYKLRTAVLGDRPALDAIYWDFSYE
jgi:hypothetical protein